MNINFNFNNFNQKKNANNFIMLGILLLVVGTITLLFENFGIKLLSFGLGAIALFLSGFIATFLALILVLIGFQLVSTGNKLKKL